MQKKILRTQALLIAAVTMISQVAIPNASWAPPKTFTMDEHIPGGSGDVVTVTRTGPGTYDVKTYPADAKPYEQTVQAGNRWEAAEKTGFVTAERKK